MSHNHNHDAPRLTVTELFAFVSTPPDDDEGVMAASIGGYMMPLIGADMARVDSLRSLAAFVSKAAGNVPYELRRFKLDQSNPPQPITNDAVKLWINAVFRGRVCEVCRSPTTLAMVKVGHEQGHDLAEILARVTSSVVLEIAGMDMEEWT